MNYNAELINLLLRMVAEIPINREIFDPLQVQCLDEYVQKEQRRRLHERLMELPPDSLAKATVPEVALDHLQFLKTGGLIVMHQYAALTYYPNQAYFWFDALPRFLIDSQCNLTEKGIDELRLVVDILMK